MQTRQEQVPHSLYFYFDVVWLNIKYMQITAADARTECLRRFWCCSCCCCCLFYSWVSRPISAVFFLSTYKYNSFTNKNTILWLVGRGLLVKPPGNRKKRRDVIIMVRGTLDWDNIIIAPVKCLRVRLAPSSRGKNNINGILVPCEN